MYFILLCISKMFCVSCLAAVCNITEMDNGYIQLL